MAWLDRLRNLVRSNRHSAELEREIAFHLAERTDHLTATGLTGDAAREEASRRFGNRTGLKERTRDADTFAWLDALIADLRLALRALGANRGFAIVAVISLALGIGANTAIFSLINAVMLRSLPVRHPETLLQVAMSNGQDNTFTNPLWEEIRRHNDLFQGAFAYGPDRFNLATDGEARNVSGEWVSGGYFSSLGVPVILGRTIAPSDDTRGCAPVAVISYGLWQTEFGGAQNAIGKTLTVNSHPFTVAGVLDPSFFGMTVGEQSQLYLPICSEPIVVGNQDTIDGRSSWWLNIMVRPLAGAIAAETGARLAAIAPSVMTATVPSDWPPDMQSSYLKRTLSANPEANGFSQLRLQYAGALRVLMVVVALVLLIACANVANLLLARATVRQHEAAIRLALGAGRARLIRQMLTEAMLLSLAGAALGVLFANWGARLITSLLSTRGGAAWLNLGIDWRMLAFTTAVALASGACFGLAPAWRSAHTDPQIALKAHGRSVVGRGRRQASWVLVAGQVALSFVLLTTAGLLLGSFRNLTMRHAGFQRTGVLLVQTDVADNSPISTDVILERMRALPGVRSAALSSMTPMGSRGENGLLSADGFRPVNKMDALAWVDRVSPGYFATVGTRLLRGRDIGPGDNSGSPSVALITETVARRLFGAADPIGRQFRRSMGNNTNPQFEVIGVVEDSKFRSMRDSVGMVIYIPAAQQRMPLQSFTLEIRSDIPPRSLMSGVKSVMAGAAPTASLEFSTLEEQVARSLSRDRLLAALATFFGGLALLLALIGLYGTMAYQVARRRNEIGIRLALGAASRRVVTMVLGEVGRVVLAGLAVGAALALVATRFIASFLFGLTASDPATWLGAIAVLFLVALVAAAVPARRASRMNPMAALREE
jgi:predicted permease